MDKIEAEINLLTSKRIRYKVIMNSLYGGTRTLYNEKYDFFYNEYIKINKKLNRLKKINEIFD